MKKLLLPMLILPTLCLAQETKIDPILLGLGEVFFFDKSLSHNKTQSCSTCHMPAAAFADLRQNDIAHMVSQGDDPTKFGNRNTPTALYASILMKKLTIMWADNSGMVEQKILQNKLEVRH